MDSCAITRLLPALVAAQPTDHRLHIIVAPCEELAAGDLRRINCRRLRDRGAAFRSSWNSYWRVDPLDQTLLDEDIAQPSVVIVGSVLRSCVQTFDEGALLDHLLSVTLNNTKLRDRVREIERDCEPGAVYTATANPTRFRRKLCSPDAIIAAPLDGKRKYTHIIVSGRFALPGIGVVL